MSLNPSQIKVEDYFLLTATPEQVGIDSHFARLRLIDPARFHSLNEFKKEQKKFIEIGDLLSSIIENNHIHEDQKTILSKYLDNNLLNKSSEIGTDTIDKIKNELLDRYGTGRVLFRNTRNAIKGFPKRIVLPYPIKDKKNIEKTSPTNQKNAANWVLEDSRVEWLQSLLSFFKKRKSLINMF